MKDDSIKTNRFNVYRYINKKKNSNSRKKQEKEKTISHKTEWKRD
jgi:hypothetical protein